MSEYNEFDGIVGAKIKAHREARKLSQGDLIEKVTEAGVPMWNRSVVTNLERGRRHLKFSEAIALAKIFGIPLTSLAPLESVHDVDRQDIEMSAAKMRGAIETLEDAIFSLGFEHPSGGNQWA